MTLVLTLKSLELIGLAIGQGFFWRSTFLSVIKSQLLGKL